MKNDFRLIGKNGDYFFCVCVTLFVARARVVFSYSLGRKLLLWNEHRIEFAEHSGVLSIRK